MKYYKFEHYLGIDDVYILAENEGRAYTILNKWYKAEDYFIS